MSIPCEYRKLGYGFDLPPGYRECEYIESTGTQWLDFEWYANGGMLCKLKGIWPTGYKQGLVMSHDARNNAGPGYNRNYLIGYGSGSSGMEFGLSDNIRAFSVPNYNNGTNVIEAEFNTRPGLAYAKVNGTVYSSFNTNTVLAPLGTVHAFYDCYESVPTKNGRLYYCTIIDVNDVVVRDLVPCLDYNGVPGMFDKVTGKTFYNKGTGQLVYKIKSDHFPIVYTELEYLESTGTQYIDTQVDIRSIGEWTLVANFINLDGIQINGCYVSDFPLAMDVGVAYSSHWFMRNGGPGDNQDTPADTEVHEFIVSQTDKATYIDGVLFSDSSLYKDISSSRDDLSIFLFYRNNRHNDNNYWCYEKIYSSTMRDRDGVLIQNLIPCLDANSVPCMFDTISGKTFYNRGTGTFKYKLK